MGPVKDHFLDLERHRRQLEENVAKLQKALQHWRMSDAEYEQLKDEVEALPERADSEDLEMIKEEFDGEVVTAKELEDFFSKKKTRSQIINTLERRIDYVGKNVATLEKQLEAAENKLAAANVVLNPDVRDEEGLPFTDIIEELDEEDNVTSFRLQRPGDMQPQMMEALNKAGIKDLPVGGEETEEAGNAEGPSTEGVEEVAAPVDFVEPKEGPSINHQKQLEEHASPPAKKGVSFAEDTKQVDGDQIPPKSHTAQRLEEIMEQARQQAIPSPNPVIPEDESPDDAELRRSMLRYGMTEIAPIVAELEIDEEADSDFDDNYSEGTDYDEDDDEHGRAQYRVVSDDYRARMQELEKKLGIKSTREIMEAESDGKLPEEGIARITVHAHDDKRPEPTPASPKPAIKTEQKAPGEKPAKKGVKFASALDVAPDQTPEPAHIAPQPMELFIDPMKSTIVERSPATQTTTVSVPTEPKKVSRFKKAKTADTSLLPIRSAAPTMTPGPGDAPARFMTPEDPRYAPTGPEGKTLAGTIVERDTPSQIKEPDEFDAALLHQEAAVEYHRIRNRMILKEGGFMKDKDAPIEYPDEEENGKPMSRFKAARLARQ